MINHDLVSTAAVRAASDAFIKTARIRQTSERPRMPLASDLVLLAIQAASLIPAPSGLPLRLRCARQMAQQTATSLRAALGLEGGDSAKVLIAKIEAGERSLPHPDQSIRKLSTMLKIPAPWLQFGGKELPEGEPITTWMPRWLEPWHELVITARTILRADSSQVIADDMDATRILSATTVPTRFDRYSMLLGLKAVISHTLAVRNGGDMWTRLAFTHEGIR